MLSWLALNRGDLTVFVHPNTGQDLEDHRDRALWLGEQVPLLLDVLQEEGLTMDSLLPLAKKVGEKLKARKETVGVSELSAGGLISAVLLAVPGASAYFMGGAVVYTRPAGEAFLTATKEKRAGIRSSSEPWATLAAELVRERLNTTWGLAETGASGPTGNSYGDPAGHTCVAVVGPKGKIARTLRTGSNDRVANMRAFAAEALKLLDEQLS